MDGHLVCFHVLFITNRATMNIGMHISFSVIVLSGYLPGVDLLDYMATLILVFLETSVLFSIVAAPIYIPNKSVRGFLFLCTFFSVCHL